jgi:hypothetical protein
VHVVQAKRRLRPVEAAAPAPTPSVPAV